MQAITDLFEEAVRKYGNNTYLLEKKTDRFLPTTYNAVHDSVLKFAAGLVQLGIKKGDRIALISEGRNAWVISELGILYAGAINVPLSVKLTEPEELEFRLKHSGARMIIASKGQLKKLQPVVEKLPDLEKIILLDPIDKYEENEILFDDITKSGTDFLVKNKTAFDAVWKSVKPDDPANICYTSGTTADPKGIVLSHRNYTANVDQSLSLMDVPEWYTSLLILPWDHAFAHSVGIYAIMKAGASIASVQTGSTPMETLKNIPINIKEIKPSFLLSVPALANNFRKNIESGVAAKGKFIKSLFHVGLKIAYTYNGDDCKSKGRGFKILLKPIYAFFNTMIFKKINENFGGSLRFFVGGGALLDIELQRFFYAIGIPMFQGYGLTEAAPVISSSSERKHKFGSSGFLVSNLELKICDEKGNELKTGEKGEIVIRGENVMLGYWKNPEATAESIRNGWLHTGDIGYMDSDGFLFVLGRFKSLLIANDGEKYSPESIEETLVGQSHFIEQCMLYNNQDPYTVCLLVPNKEAIKRWIKEKHHHLKREEAVTESLKLIEHELVQYKAGYKYGKMFPQRWLPSATAILEEAFTEENHMMNSTMKIVRGKIEHHYKELLNFLYTPEAKNIICKRNIEAVKNILGELL
jgi:long-chain acyl-CoA synthetase